MHVCMAACMQLILYCDNGLRMQPHKETNLTVSEFASEWHYDI